MASDLNDLDKVFADLDTGPARPRAKTGPRMLPIAVAAIALIGFGAIIWYAYSQGVRSGSEDAAPLLQPQGEAKTLPSDPGGMDVPHRDKTVYDCTLNPERCVDGVERILPPPEDPMRPTIVEQPPVQEQAPNQLAAQSQPAAPPPPPSLLTAPASPPTLSVTQSSQPPVPQTAPVAPVTSSSQPQQQASQSAAPVPNPPAAAPAPAQAAPAQTAAAQAPAPANAPKSGVVNGWKIQLAALRSEAEVQSDWARRQAKLPSLLGNLTLHIESVEVKGKGTFYRMQAGPLSDKAAADALCGKLKAEKMDCLSVKP